MKVAFYTLGCKVNQYDSQAMAGYLQRAGHTIVPFDGPADAYVINSCTVTAESDRKTRQAIGKAKKHNPDALVCVAGCYAQHAGPALLQRGDVDAVLGTGRSSASSRCWKAPGTGKSWMLWSHTAPWPPMRKGRARSSSGRVRI